MMTDANNHPSRDDLSAYALGALDAQETLHIQQHLLACADCQQILEGYRAVANGLLFAVPPQSPSPQLRSRLAAQISTSARVETREDHGHRQVSTGPRWNWILPIALGFAVIILLSIDVSLALQVRSLQQQQQALLKIIQANQAGMALVSQPGAIMIGVNGSHGAGNLVIGPDGLTAVMFVQKMPALDSDHIYQVWLIPSAGSPVSAGLFQGPADQSSIPVIIISQQPLKNFAKIGITVEPKGGSRLPTTTPILLGDL